MSRTLAILSLLCAFSSILSPVLAAGNSTNSTHTPSRNSTTPEQRVTLFRRAVALSKGDNYIQNLCDGEFGQRTQTRVHNVSATSTSFSTVSSTATVTQNITSTANVTYTFFATSTIVANTTTTSFVATATGDPFLRRAAQFSSRKEEVEFIFYKLDHEDRSQLRKMCIAQTKQYVTRTTTTTIPTTAFVTQVRTSTATSYTTKTSTTLTTSTSTIHSTSAVSTRVALPTGLAQPQFVACPKAATNFAITANTITKDRVSCAYSKVTRGSGYYQCDYDLKDGTLKDSQGFNAATLCPAVVAPSTSKTGRLCEYVGSCPAIPGWTFYPDAFARYAYINKDGSYSGELSCVYKDSTSANKNCNFDLLTGAATQGSTGCPTKNIVPIAEGYCSLPAST